MVVVGGAAGIGGGGVEWSRKEAVEREGGGGKGFGEKGGMGR